MGCRDQWAPWDPVDLPDPLDCPDPPDLVDPLASLVTLAPLVLLAHVVLRDPLASLVKTVLLEGMASPVPSAHPDLRARVASPALPVSLD